MSEIIIRMPEGQKELRIQSLPEGGLKMERLVRLGRKTLIVGPDGGLYTMLPLHMLRIVNWWQAGDWLPILSRLKLLPKGMLKQAKVKQAAEEKKERRSSNVRKFRELCKELGVEVTRVMEKQLRSRK